MVSHQRRDLTHGNNFTFSNPIYKEPKSQNHSDGMEYETWAERIKGQHNSFSKPSDTKFGPWARRAPKSYNHDEDEFRWLQARKAEDDDSGTPAPELWKKAESPVIPSAGCSPARSYGYSNERDARFSHITHSARSQKIAKYRQEMLELVRGMPETAYELSLRDIVESPKITTPLQEHTEDKSEEGKDKSKKKMNKKKKEEEKMMSRSESTDTGFLLKKFIPRVPSVLGGRKSSENSATGAKVSSKPMLGDGADTGFLLKKFIPRVPSVLGGRKSSDNSATGAKVSPKPVLGDGEKSGSEKSTDREWWSEEFGQMTSSSGSSNSSNSTGSRDRRKLKGCYSFFKTR